jgi:type VI secretion system secreted protein Hcp
MDILVLDCGEKIKGECTLTDFKDKIELLSFSHGVAQQITGDPSNQKRTSGKPNHQDMTITKYVDLASCGLVDYCNQAKLIPKAILTVGQNDNGEVIPLLVYTLTNAIVSSVSVGGGGGGKPQETITLNYSKIEWAYKQQKTDITTPGVNSAKWSLETNKAE